MESEDSFLLKESVIRGHHVFKDVWTPRVGEILRIGNEAGNTHDRRAVAVLNVPINIMPHYPPYGQMAGNIGALTEGGCPYSRAFDYR